MYAQNIYKHLADAGIHTLYHFTSLRNMPSIERMGGLLSWQQLNQRRIDHVRCSDDLSRSLDARRGLANHVRLSLVPNTPMYFVVRNYRVSDVHVIEIPITAILDRPDVYVANDNAASNRAVIGHDPMILPIDELRTIGMLQRQGRPDAYNGTLRQAEVLVQQFIPIRPQILRSVA